MLHTLPCAPQSPRAANWRDNRSGTYFAHSRSSTLAPRAARKATIMMFKRYGSVLAMGLSSLFGLGGCVGYDGSADGASSHAQGLGVTSAEESSILGALAQKPMTTEELDKIGASLDKAGLPTEWRTVVLQTQATGRGKADGVPCSGDINCNSLHCDQVGVCRRATDFKARGTSCSQGWECASNRCTISSSGTGSCDALPADFDATTNGGETDKDCGGPLSPYACALGEVCQTNDDCVAGICGGTGSARKCGLQNRDTNDLGRLWPRNVPANTSPPYAKSVGIPAERDKAAQIAWVSARPPMYGAAASPTIAAESTRSFQHDTCVQHLLANGCSSLSVQTRTHRASYDYVICPTSSRSQIGITAATETTSSAGTVFASEGVRGQKTLSEDPYLCNHSYTRGVRALTFTAGADVPAPGRVYDSYSNSKGNWEGFQATAITSTNKTTGLEWFRQLRGYLLEAAACSRGRVVVADTQLGAAPVPPTRATTKQLLAACTSPLKASSSPAALALPRQTAVDSVLLYRMNIAWYDTVDIYSIDPEGNPNLPANMNLQYGWDAIHPNYSFGSYASSWGVALVPTSKTYSFGTTQTVWGTSSTATFGWNVR